MRVVRKLLRLVRDQLPGWTIAFAVLDDSITGYCDCDAQIIWINLAIRSRNMLPAVLRHINDAMQYLEQQKWSAAKRPALRAVPAAAEETA